MRHHAGTLLRTIATLLTLTAERLDPQPPAAIPSWWVHGENVTSGSSVKVTWHRTC